MSDSDAVPTAQAVRPPEPPAAPQPPEPSAGPRSSEAAGTAGPAGPAGPAGSPEDGHEAGRSARLARLEEEGEVAADYLEELLDIADLDGDIDLDVEDGRAVVSVVAESGGEGLEHLVGASGSVLEALQDLVRLAVQARTGERSRLVLDVAGYRARRRAELTRLAQDVVETVRAGSGPVEMEPMNPFERKVVHDVVAAAGLLSDSEGVEPSRYVVVRSAPA